MFSTLANTKAVHIKQYVICNSVYLAVCVRARGFFNLHSTLRSVVTYKWVIREMSAHNCIQSDMECSGRKGIDAMNFKIKKKLLRRTTVLKKKN